MGRFKPVTRKQTRLRFGLDGTSGSGKSYSALRLAFAFKLLNPNIRIAAIEAGERGGLSLYKGEAPDGVPFEFDGDELVGNYSPTEYTQAIEDAGRDGYDVLIIDSLSHAWTGSGGALDQVGSKAFQDKDGWRTVTPQHNRMIEAILQSPCHIFATLRSKTEYIIEEDERGKKVPRKVGLAPIQRAGMEYEFTIYGSVDPNHTLTVTKSRCSMMQDLIVHKPGAGIMRPLIQWLETGEVVEMPEIPKRAGEEQLERIASLTKELGVSREKFREGLAGYGVSNIKELNNKQADDLEGKMQGALERKKAAAAAKAAATNPGAASPDNTNNATVSSTPTA